MKLTNKQRNDLEVIKYFIPPNLKNQDISDKDIEMFFEYSDQWKHKGICKTLVDYSRFMKDSEKVGTYTLSDLRWLEALLQGKRWRGIHIHEMYEPAITDWGRYEYSGILCANHTWRKPRWFWVFLSKFWVDRCKYVNTPRSVIEFLKKEMFQWRDSDFIENMYVSLLK